MKRWYSLLAGVLALIGCGRDKAYHAQLKMFSSAEVPDIEADSLLRLQQEREVLLLDVRSPAEQQVSQLAGAVALDYDQFALEQLDTVPKDRAIVVYCAVGYRSAKAAEKLKQAGYQQVYNLYGGIMEWKNEGHVVVTPAGKPTEQVHTYNSYWSSFLEKGEAVY